jgi:heptosyltransferase I
VKILILKPSSLGDIIHAMPVLRLLKRHLPESAIYWWISSTFAPMLEGDPDLAGMFPFERTRWAHPRYWPELFQSIRRLRTERFDWVIDLQGLARSGAAAWLAHGRWTVGVDDPREGASLFYDRAVPRPSPRTHAVDWYLATLRSLGVPVHGPFTWLPERPETRAAVQAKWNTNGSRWLIINPGARWLNKRWPAQHFARVVAEVTRRMPEMRFAILGGAADRDLGAAIAQVRPDRCVDLTGQTSLAEMVEWIRLAEAIVTNDTGPMHVAAALGTPMVALFGPTNPHRTGPYRRLEDVVQLSLDCVPCMKAICRASRPLACLQDLEPSLVVDRVLQRLRSASCVG